MTPSALPLVDANQLADTGSLAALKQAAAKQSPQALREAARQFESLFVSMVLKSVRQANFKDPLFGSDQGDMYQDMYDDQVAAEITKGKGLGLADMLVQQLRRESGSTPSASVSEPATGAAPGSAAAPRAGATRTAAIPTAWVSPEARTATTTAGAPAAMMHNDAQAPSGTSPSGCPTSADQARFARSLWPEAQQAAVQLGVSPVTLLAQAALETDWGRSMPGGTGAGTSSNLFGIKATSGWGGDAVQSSTREWGGGGASTVQAPFRAYGSTSQCFQDYVALLRGNPRYAAALGTGGDVQAFGSALQRGGYATDPTYASKLTAVAGTLTRALAAQSSGTVTPSGMAASEGGSDRLKLAAGLPIHPGSGPLQRR